VLILALVVVVVAQANRLPQFPRQLLQPPEEDARVVGLIGGGNKFVECAA
jgi:hypothetical protein